MGNVFAEAKKPEEARKAFEALNKIKPDADVLAANLARVEVAAGRFDASLAELQKYFDSGSTATGISPYELLAEILSEQKNGNELVSKLESLQKSQPHNAPLALYLGEQYRKAGKLDSAHELLEASLAEKYSTSAAQSLVDVYMQSDDAKPLFALLTKMVEEGGTLSLTDSNAKRLFEDKQLPPAIIELALKQNAEAKAEDRYALRAAALLAIQAKKWKEAESLVNLAMKADPKAAPICLRPGDWRWCSKRSTPMQPACSSAELTISRPAMTIRRCVFIYLVRWKCKARPTRRWRPQKRLPKSTRKMRTSSAARRGFCTTPSATTTRAKAYEEFIQKFDDDYSSPEVRQSLREARSILSNICEQQHETAKAVEWLEQILDESPDDAGTNNDLGFLWADEGRASAARLPHDSIRGRRRAGKRRLSRQLGLGAVSTESLLRGA